MNVIVPKPSFLVYGAIRTTIFRAATDLIRVGDVGAAVAGVSHAVSVPVQLVSVLDTLAVIQKVLQACSAHNKIR